VDLFETAVVFVAAFAKPCWSRT